MRIAKNANTGTHRKKQICALLTFYVRNAINTRELPGEKYQISWDVENTPANLIRMVHAYLNDGFILTESEESQ